MIFDNGNNPFGGERADFSTNGAGKTRYLQAGPLSNTIYKKQLKVNQRAKCKTLKN
jgi:hypothetical protein